MNCISLKKVAQTQFVRTYRLSTQLMIQQKSNFSAWAHFPESKAPLIEKFHSSWPEPRPTNELIEEIPVKTVPENILRFQLSATFDKGMAIFYPHLKMHPADLKVIMSVNIDDLELSPEEKRILIEMIGKRYNVGKREFKLITERFPNRIENKKYLMYQLECLLFETRRLGKIEDLFEDIHSLKKTTISSTVDTKTEE